MRTRRTPACEMDNTSACSRAVARTPLSHVRTLVVLAMLLACMLIVTPTLRASAATPRVPVILDTDMYSSADDVGAESTLFALDLTGQDSVIALGVNTRFDRPQVATNSWKCVAAIAQFYGLPEHPDRGGHAG